MPGGQLFDPRQDRTVVGDVSPGLVVLDRQRIDLAAQQRMREQTLEFGRKRDAAVTQPRGIQRLHAQPIAREQKPPGGLVIEREGEHAMQARQAIDAPLLPCRQDRLAIALGGEFRTERRQFAAQLAIIVDLAVEHQHRAAIDRGHRLGRSGEVDDREAAVA